MFQTPVQIQNNNEEFYEAIADYYHLFFRDWDAVMQREGATLRRLFRDKGVKTVLDASCGMGTQAIALALNNFEVTAADPNQKMMQRARENAQKRGVMDDITFVRAGFLALPKVLNGPYDAIVTKGNALLHLLTDEEILDALHNFHTLLRPGGTVNIGVRDFNFMLEDRPRFVPVQAHLDDLHRDYILFDIYDWNDGPPVTVTFNTFIVSGKGDQYTATRHPITFRALRRNELESMLAQVGFVSVQVEPQGWENVFTARKPE